jgi:hypothetical protein
MCICHNQVLFQGCPNCYKLKEALEIQDKKINFIYNLLRNIKHQATNTYYNFQTFQKKLKKVLLLYLLVGVSEYFDLNLQWKQDTPNCDVISAGTWNQNSKMINCSPNKSSSLWLSSNHAMLVFLLIPVANQNLPAAHRFVTKNLIQGPDIAALSLSIHLSL